MRHLKTLGVGSSDLIPPISTNMTALTDCPIRYRSLAFPSAADLFDVQSSFNHMIVNNIQLNKFVELTLYLEPDSEITNVVLSSLSTFSQIATEGLLYPSTSATSLPHEPRLTVDHHCSHFSEAFILENLNFHIHSKLT